MTDAPPPPSQPYQQPAQPLSPQDEKLWSTLTHVGGILFSFVVPLITYLVFKDRGPFVREHTRQALNFTLTMLIGYLAGILLSVIFIGFLISLAAWVLSVIFGIIAAVAANKGEIYKYPIAIQFVR